ncbi:MAG TPA: hypothetical protein VE422_49030 [Terriglobia bacterium]|nr:hypothetical protein [Terriglobia bacterium]
MKTTAHAGQTSTSMTAVATLEIEIEELEEIMAPKLAVNHNETFVRDEEIRLDV